MKKETKYRYFKTLFESIRVVFKNPALLIPFILSSVIGMLLIPFTAKLQDPNYIFQNLLLVFLSYLFLFLLSIIIYGWTLSMLNQLFNKKEINIGKAFKRCFSFGLRLLGIALLTVLFMIIIYIAVALLILIIFTLVSLIKIELLAAILGGIIGALFLLFIVLFFTAFMQVIPVLAVEDKGVIGTIRRTLGFYFKKKIFSLNMFLMTIFSMIVLSIPAAIYQVIVVMDSIIFQQTVYTSMQLFILSLLYLIPNLFVVVILVFYCRSYIIKKETIKAK